MVKNDFFFGKKKEWKPYFGFSIYSTIGTQVSQEVRNNYKKYKSLKFVLFEIERQPMLLSKPIVPEQVITRFDITFFLPLFVEKCHLRYKRLESIFNQRRTRIWWVELFFAENYILVWILNIVTKKAFITKRPYTNS